MALTQKEKDLVLNLRKRGYNTKEISGFIAGQRVNQTSSISEDISKQLITTNEPGKEDSGFVSRIKDVPSDIKETFQGAVRETTKGIETGKEAAEDVVEGKISPLKGTARIIGAGLRAGARVVGEGVLGAAKLITKPKTEKKVADIAEGVAQNVVETELAQSLIQKYQELDEETQKDVQAALGVTEGLLEIGALGVATRFSKPAIKAAIETADSGLSKATDLTKTLFTRRAAFNSVDDLITKTDDTLKQASKLETSPSVARTLAESQAPDISLSEKWIGLTPDVKKRIQQAGPNKTQEYLDVVAIRNVDDTAPTAFEFGGDQARKATERMEELLNSTGSQIGRTRQRFGNLRASVDQINNIESKFTKELGKLNLQIKNGVISQKPGTISKLGSASDIKTIQSLFNELRTLKQNPNLTNLIDFRNITQAQINFLKSGREISDSVDPFARAVRGQVKLEAAQIVGRSEAKLLNDYMEFMDAFSDIKSFTDRKAGGEYLLRLALSGRGGEARKIIETIKLHTGADLMDDAVLMTTVTDLLANQNQRNLFSQELTKSGVNVARVLSGDPRGALPFVGKFIEKNLLNPEDILKEAAQR